MTGDPSRTTSLERMILRSGAVTLSVRRNVNGSRYCTTKSDMKSNTSAVTLGAPDRVSILGPIAHIDERWSAHGRRRQRTRRRGTGPRQPGGSTDNCHAIEHCARGQQTRTGCRADRLSAPSSSPSGRAPRLRRGSHSKRALRPASRRSYTGRIRLGGQPGTGRWRRRYLGER